MSSITFSALDPPGEDDITMARIIEGVKKGEIKAFTSIGNLDNVCRCEECQKNYNHGIEKMLKVTNET